MSEFPVAFQPMARPYAPFSPPRSLDPGVVGPIWKGMLNMHVRDGLLRFREGIGGLSDIPQDANPQDEITAPVGGSDPVNNQVPRVILDIHDSLFPGRLVVTDREMLFYWADDNTWTNLTPLNKGGTVSITNGTSALTFVGTVLQTQGFQSRNYIELPNGSGSFYEIASIDSETTATLTSTFTGTTIVAGVVNIRRSWDPSVNPQLSHYFAQFFDGDLYVAGPFGEVSDGIVLRINDCASVKPTTASVEYLFGGLREYVTGLDFIGETNYIFGQQVVEDGRVVLAVRENLASPSHTARVRFSSNLDSKVWTISPAGARDAVPVQGSVTGLGRIGFDMTVHFTDRIELASFTGVDDTPFTFRRTRAEFGTVSPMALINMHGTEVFPCQDFNIRSFQGATSQVYSENARDYLERAGTTFPPVTLDALDTCHAVHYETRDEYRIFIPTPFGAVNGTNTGFTDAIYIDRFGEAYPQNFGYEIGAVAHKIEFAISGPQPVGSRERGYSRGSQLIGIVGLRSHQNPNVGTGLTTIWMPSLNQSEGKDVNLTGIDDSTALARPFVETDILGPLASDMLITRLLLWYGIGGQDMVVEVSYDGGETFPVTFTLDLSATTANGELVARGYFPEQSGSSLKLRLAPVIDGTFGFRLDSTLHNMVAYLVDVADEVAA